MFWFSVFWRVLGFRAFWKWGFWNSGPISPNSTAPSWEGRKDPGSFTETAIQDPAIVLRRLHRLTDASDVLCALATVLPQRSGATPRGALAKGMPTTVEVSLC